MIAQTRLRMRLGVEVVAVDAAATVQVGLAIEPELAAGAGGDAAVEDVGA